MGVILPGSKYLPRSRGELEHPPSVDCDERTNGVFDDRGYFNNLTTPCLLRLNGGYLFVRASATGRFYLRTVAELSALFLEVSEGSAQHGVALRTTASTPDEDVRSPPPGRGRSSCRTCAR